MTQLPGDSATAASRNLADVPLLATSMLQRLPHKRLQHRCFKGIDVTGTHPLDITHLPPLSTVTLPSELQVTAGGHGSSELRAAGFMSCATEQPLETGDARRERQQRPSRWGIGAGLRPIAGCAAFTLNHDACVVAVQNAAELHGVRAQRRQQQRTVGHRL